MDRKEKIKNLQIRNSRRLFCEKMKQYIEEITIDDFISMDDTIQLQNKILWRMDEMDKKEKSLKEPINASYASLFKMNCDIFSKYNDAKVIFFHRQAIDIGAIEISVSSIMKNIDYIILTSEMYEYGCSIFLVSQDMRFGLCLWKSEYNFTIYKWTE